MGSRSKSNFRDYNHYFKVEETWLYRDVGTSFIVQPFKVRTAVYETRTYGGVRGALRQLSWRSRLLNYRAFFFRLYYCSVSLSAYKMSFGKRSFCKYFMPVFVQKLKFIRPIVPLSNQLPSLS